MASVQARRPTITALPGASDFAAAAASSAHSPLDQLGLAMRRGGQPDVASAAAVAAAPRAAPPPIPTLDLNLFRSPSIYSVESNLDTISLTSEEHDAAYGDSSIGYGYGFTHEPEEQGTDEDDDDDDDYGSPEEGTEINFGAEPSTSTPSTPRAARRMASDEVIGGSPVRSGASTPTFRVHRPNQHAGGPAPPPVPTVPFNVRSAVSDGPFALRPVPVRSQRSASSLASSTSTTTTVTLQPRAATEPVPRDAPVVTRDAPAPHQPQHSTVPDWASVHGEQGSDWGDDEAEFEWLDKGHPEAMNGNTNGTLPRRLGLSPKRLSRIRAAVPNLTPTNLVPPSFAAGSGSGGSSGSNSSASSPVSPGPPDGPQRMRTKKKRPIVIPRRAAPPPPTGAPSALPQTRSRSPQPLRSPPTRDGNSVFDSHPSAETPRARDQSSPELEGPVLPPVVIINATPDRVARRQPPLMVPLKDGDGGNRPTLRRVPSHQSEHSMQSSLAYSFYDLDDPSRAPSRAESPSRMQEAQQPRGRYAKIPITTIDPAGGSRVRVTDTTRSPVTPVTPGTPGTPGVLGPNAHSRLNLQSASTTSLSSISAAGLTPDELVAAGLEQRRAGHLPKAAYMFMKAGEAGGATGQIYWGLALRHGQGVARDERRGFTEILQACDRSLAEGPIDLRAAAGSILTPQQVQTMTPGLSLGLYEVACCFLDGTGVKRSPDTALEYLRMAGSLGDLNAQEELGLLLAKGGHGVRKDMKESAKWYRAALEQGLNTPGLAWVWKEKYN
ncbi:hypothetical protein Q8F55_006509 [Vanrija albida]|uniref:HCP-like protein n=1 Tax=Vanrija albida TaxID=181172 RepID=A0ABR3PXE3_9TREE